MFLEVGGRYQITHVCLSGHAGPGSDAELLEAVSSVLEDVVVFVEVERVRVGIFFSMVSRGVGGVDFCAAEVCEVSPRCAKSKAVPGVLGVLVAEPKPNAPLPRPNADDAPGFGDVMLEVARGEMVLKGLVRLSLVAPKRLVP